MFPKVPKLINSKIAFAIFLICALSVVITYLLITGNLEVAAGAAGFLSAALAFAQWVISQSRESAKTTWEAVKLYYTERDTAALIEVNHAIHSSTWNPSQASTYCNFYEKWGRLVELGYLPIEIFDGSSGISLANACIRLKSFLLERRQNNPRYASCVVSLVKDLRYRGYLKSLGASADSDVSLFLYELNAG